MPFLTCVPLIILSSVHRPTHAHRLLKAHTHMRGRTHLFTHTRTHLLARADTYTHARARTHTVTTTHTHARTHARTYTEATDFQSSPSNERWHHIQHDDWTYTSHGTRPRRIPITTWLKDLATQANINHKEAIAIPRDRKKWKSVGNPRRTPDE